MAAIDLKDKRTWRCFLWAPVVPTLVVTVGALLFGTIGVGLLQLFGLAGAVSGLLFVILGFVLNFITAYVIGLMIILVFGMLLRNLLPDRIPDIPVVSWLNSSRWGRIILIFATLIVFGALGISGMLFLFALMCLFEFSSGYDTAYGIVNKNTRSQSAFY